MDEFVVITGLSAAGRSLAADDLEDLDRALAASRTRDEAKAMRRHRVEAKRRYRAAKREATQVLRAPAAWKDPVSGVRRQAMTLSTRDAGLRSYQPLRPGLGASVLGERQAQRNVTTGTASGYEHVRVLSVDDFPRSLRCALGRVV